MKNDHDGGVSLKYFRDVNEATNMEGNARVTGDWSGHASKERPMARMARRQQAAFLLQ